MVRGVAHSFRSVTTPWLSWQACRGRPSKTPVAPLERHGVGWPLIIHMTMEQKVNFWHILGQHLRITTKVIYLFWGITIVNPNKKCISCPFVTLKYTFVNWNLKKQAMNCSGSDLDHTTNYNMKIMGIRYAHRDGRTCTLLESLEMGEETRRGRNGWWGQWCLSC